MKKLLVVFATLIAMLAAWQLVSSKDSKRLFKNGAMYVASNDPSP